MGTDKQGSSFIISVQLKYYSSFTFSGTCKIEYNVPVLYVLRALLNYNGNFSKILLSKKRQNITIQKCANILFDLRCLTYLVYTSFVSIMKVICKFSSMLFVPKLLRVLFLKFFVYFYVTIFIAPYL